MAARSQETTTRWSKSASEPTRESNIAKIAGRQLRLITTSQLGTVGLSQNAVRTRARRGRLVRLHQGVYATHPPPFSRDQQWLAAVLACGPGALLSDWPAAIHLEITESGPSLPPHVMVPTGRGRSRMGMIVHERGPVDPRDVRQKNAIPVTSVDLVLVHLSPHLDEAELEQMLVAAESRRLLNRRRLAELVSERTGRPGTAKLCSLLALEPAIAESDMELLMIPIYRLAGVARPFFNHPILVPGRIKPLVVDLAWPDLRLVVEFDSQRWHGDWERAEADRERDHLLALAGHLCHRFFRRQVRKEPDEAAHLLSRLVALRAAEVR